MVGAAAAAVGVVMSGGPPRSHGVPVGAEVLPGYGVVALLAHGKRMDTYDATASSGTAGAW